MFDFENGAKLILILFRRLFFSDFFVKKYFLPKIFGLDIVT